LTSFKGYIGVTNIDIEKGRCLSMTTTSMTRTRRHGSMMTTATTMSFDDDVVIRSSSNDDTRTTTSLDNDDALKYNKLSYHKQVALCIIRYNIIHNSIDCQHPHLLSYPSYPQIISAICVRILHIRTSVHLQIHTSAFYRIMTVTSWCIVMVKPCKTWRHGTNPSKTC